MNINDRQHILRIYLH